ncbi:MAG: ABC transporter permease, partial [Fimbriimonadaceae bacterium]|nr:ABC transporter permease [Fimbriimonadaceae bacterium]
MADPLRPSVYLVRNAARSLPMVGVIILAVMLIAGIVSLMNSIPLSIRTIYSYIKTYVAVTPRGDLTAIPQLEQELRKAPETPERIMKVRVTERPVRSIVGAMPFPVIGMRSDDLTYTLDRLADGRLEGRLPKPGAAEVVVSEPVLRNLKLKLGDPLLKPEDAEAFSPFPVTIVGVIPAPIWVAYSDYDY